MAALWNMRHLTWLYSSPRNWLQSLKTKVRTAAAAKSLQSCPTLCNPIEGSPPGSPIPGILQARTLEWVAISFSNAWKWKVKVKLLSRARPTATAWTAAHQAPPSMGFSRQEYWSGVPLPSPKVRTTLVKSAGLKAHPAQFWRLFWISSTFHPRSKRNHELSRALCHLTW